MSLKTILFAGSALASLIVFAAPAEARAPYYRCGDDWCYDDQYEETRELNLLQLEHPGAGVRAVPGHDGDYDDDDDDEYGDDRRGWHDRRGDWDRTSPYEDDYGDADDNDDDDDGDD